MTHEQKKEAYLFYTELNDKNGIQCINSPIKNYFIP